MLTSISFLTRALFSSLVLISSPLQHVTAVTTVNGQTQCYAPDGSTPTIYDYTPCIAVAGVDSMCCALNRTLTGNPYTPDICAPNGLCLNGRTYFRDFCTDPTWESPMCLRKEVCGYDSNNQLLSGTLPLTECTDGTWCCGQDNFTDCCSKNLGFQIASTLVDFSKLIATTAASSSTNGNPTSTSTSAAQSTSAPPSCTIPSTASSTSSSGPFALPTCPKESNKVWLGVVIALGVLVIVGSIASFWFGQKRGRSMEPNMVPGMEIGFEHNMQNAERMGIDPNEIRREEVLSWKELPSATQGRVPGYWGSPYGTHEMANTQKPAELGPGRASFI